ncbi:hypothetical protein L2E82_35315 [Cichorium intybus]|uniref:Uncharacterized protein n=1 Tax=Cichorium intybus TaxID=13427 RepID=A0ACB9BNV2_CICIN|nr:hypothetical protein L2E82_35315 [Cichorium intybus]
MFDGGDGEIQGFSPYWWLLVKTNVATKVLEPYAVETSDFVACISDNHGVLWWFGGLRWAVHGETCRQISRNGGGGQWRSWRLLVVVKAVVAEEVNGDGS